ncbi:MAG: GTP 3',8-cyclase MoaA [Candidatus Cyclobacteriaceae bacterium M3_2C_046]
MLQKYKKTIVDNFGRPLTYLRLSVTDRCNLRCFYCMPAEGIKYLAKDQLLSYEEMLRLSHILAGMGIEKIRITGGEPFLRKDLIYFLSQLKQIKDLKEISLTTNGILTAGFIPQLQKLGIDNVNLSLDTLDQKRFFQITRRNEFDKVWHTLEEMKAHHFKIKINTVVMEGKNEQDIVPLVNLTRQYPLAVRFIEEMPFNGSGQAPANNLNWNHHRILHHIKKNFPTIQKLPDPPFSTSDNYQIPGFKGQVGVIAAFSRTFCGSCNRIRITALGQLKNCLYDHGVLDLKQILRDGITDQELENLLLKKFQQREKNGFEAEIKANRQNPSMSTIGG